jgi:hypothetical protein
MPSNNAQHSRLMQDIQIKIGLRDDARLFKNQVGMLKDANGQRVRFGLCRGSSDLIGWQSVTITPAMVGTKVAIFTAIELKTGKSWPTKPQRLFIEAVKKHGGKAGIARSIEDAHAILSA